MKKKGPDICVIYQCRNKKYKDKELCHNHWVIRDQLFSYKNRDMIKNRINRKALIVKMREMLK